MAELDIALLGAFQLRVAGKLIPDLTLVKAQALLAYLAVESATQHRRAQLALLLWPDQPRNRAFDSLRQTLFTVRQWIPAHYLHVTRLDLQFDTAHEHLVDVMTFTQLLKICRHHAHDTPISCPTCLDNYRQAVALYRGDFLEQLVLPDCAAFEEWALLKREWLRREVLTALAHLTTAAEEHGDYAQAYLHAWRQIELDPLREEAHCQLMRALALSARRSEALSHYEICRGILAEEMNAKPAQATTALYEQIRDGQLLAPTVQMPSLPLIQQIQTGLLTHSQTHPHHPIPHGPTTHNLPAPLMPLVGREQEKTAIGQFLVDPTVRLLTVLGPGGVGKTHLALVTAAEQVAHFHDGVYWVELAAVESVAALLVAIAQALQLDAKEDDALQQQVIAHLQSKCILLLLDNFEHLLPAVDLVVDLLKGLPGLTIMVTSRVRLQVQSEQIFPVSGLTFPTTQSEADLPLSQYSAPALFIQQARRLRPDFRPHREDWSAISQICCALQGMPLGILLAAAWARDYTLTAIAHEIDENLDFLASNWRDAPTRHQSMRAVFDHSWRLLSVREQRIFQQLAVFRGGFTAAAAEAVTGAALPELMALVDRSLVQRSLSSSAQSLATARFVLHELVRQYAVEKLTANQSLHYQTALYHAAYFTDFLEKQDADMGTVREATALMAIDPEVENIGIAWHWAIAEKQIDLLQRTLPGLNRYCRSRRRHRFCDRALGLAAANMELLVALPSPPSAWLYFLAKLYSERAFYRWMAGDLVESEQLLQQTVALLTQLERAGEPVDEAKAYTLRELGRITSQNDRTRARSYFVQSLAIYRTLNNAAGLAHILAFLGDLAWNMGDYRAARGWIEQGLAKQATVADPELLANLLNLLGIVALHQGNLVEAERLQGEALATAQSVGRIGRHEKFHLGVTLVWAGRFSAGYQLLSERIQQADSEGMPGALAAAYVHTGEALLHLGRYRDARKLVCQGLEIANVHKSPRLMGDTLRMLGQIELAERRFSEASTHLHESIAALRTIDQLGSLGWSLATLGYVAYFMGNLPTARSHLREALQIAKETTAFFPLLMAMPACALLYLAQEEPARTLELYALATRYPLVANSCWFAEIVGRSITNTAGRLHPHLQETAYRPECIADPWAVAAIILDDLR